MKKNICILIVTFNRKKYLEKLLNNLISQKDQISGIFIFDNNSSDGTEDMLKKMHIIDNVVKNKVLFKNDNYIDYYFYKNSENGGGARGFHEGLKMVHDMNKFEYIWIMDDDVLPEQNCLKYLMKYQSEDTMITIPNRTDENFNDKVCIAIDKKNPFKIFMHKKSMLYIEEIEKKEYIEVVDMPFEGPLINCKLIDKIGLPDETYFIQFDDTDYATRATKFTKIKFIKNATLHKQIIPQNDKKKQMDWKDYYAYRNDILFCKKYGENIFVKYLTPIFLYGNMLVKAIIKRKRKNIKVMSKAFYDGYTGKKGKTVEPGEF